MNRSQSQSKFKFFNKKKYWSGVSQQTYIKNPGYASEFIADFKVNLSKMNMN